eukprot:3786790-Amphidinium_carterae.1
MAMGTGQVILERSTAQRGRTAGASKLFILALDSKSQTHNLTSCNNAVASAKTKANASSA